MEDMTNAPVLETLVAVTFGNRVAVIGDERKVTAVLAAGKPVSVHTADGAAKVTPGARWVKRNGAMRFNLRGETGFGPKGGRRRYSQTVAAFYCDDDVTPCEFEDGASLLTAEADSHDAPTAKVTGTTKATKAAKATATVAATDVDAIVAAAVAKAVAEALAAVNRPTVPAPTKVTPVPVPTATTRKVTSTRRNGTKASTAESLLGL